MANLVAYGVIGGSSLVKAQCDVCKKEYGTIEEAQLCEAFHRLHEKEKQLSEFRQLRTAIEKTIIGVDLSHGCDMTAIDGKNI